MVAAVAVNESSCGELDCVEQRRHQANHFVASAGEFDCDGPTRCLESRFVESADEFDCAGQKRLQVKNSSQKVWNHKIWNHVVLLPLSLVAAAVDVAVVLPEPVQPWMEGVDVDKTPATVVPIATDVPSPTDQQQLHSLYQ